MEQKPPSDYTRISELDIPRCDANYYVWFPDGTRLVCYSPANSKKMFCLDDHHGQVIKFEVSQHLYAKRVFMFEDENE